MKIEPVPTTETLKWLPICAAVASISVVGIAIGLGTPLLSIILESRGYSASMIGLNTAVAGYRHDRRSTAWRRRWRRVSASSGRCLP